MARPWLRTLMAYLRGDPRVCSMARAPTPQEEDRRRLCRERKTLMAERGRHINRIKGLLFAQGVFGYEPLRKHRRERLEELRTGDGRPLPAHLKAQILRELDRLEVLLAQLTAVDAERNALFDPAPDEVPSPAAMLARLKGIGPDFATILWSEGLYRHFDNRRQVAAYAGLAPTPWKSGVHRSRAGRVQGGQPAATHRDGRAGLDVAAAPADLSAQSVVPRSATRAWADASARPPSSPWRASSSSPCGATRAPASSSRAR